MGRFSNPTMWRPVSMLLMVLLAASGAAGRTIYVDGHASRGANDGSSWADACNYLQDALADANASPKPVEIRVAQGIYKPDQGASQTPADREATFQIINGVTLKGSYAGFGQPDPNARDVDQYQTILNGDLNGDDGLDFLNNGENSYHVVSGSRTEPSAILDGFTITGGNADGPRFGEYPPYDYSCMCGGGMYNDLGHPTVSKCTFSHNAAACGGGMYNVHSDPTLISCAFIANSASARYDLSFLPEGISGQGGGMANSYGSPTLTNCTFIGNQCRRPDSFLLYTAGGGMHNSASHPTLTRCVFSANSAEDSAGGMYNTDSNPRLIECRFTDNSAAWGGGMRNSDSSPILVSCVFSANRANGSQHVLIPGAPGRGAGIENWYSSPTLSNCTFSGNRCLRAYASTSSLVQDVQGGGGIYSTGSRLRMTNCIFTRNSALTGDTLACCSLRFLKDHSNVELTNCILWGGGSQIWNNDGSTITITHSDVQGGQTASHDPCSAVIWGEGNMDADPCFAEPGYWDPNGTPEDSNDDLWIDGDYHCKSQAGRWDPVSESWVIDGVTSPCIDAGDPMSPIGHEPFPNGGIINMGVYGGTAEASKSYFGEPVCETIVAGDINGDCKVDFRDFAIMALHWLEGDDQ